MAIIIPYGQIAPKTGAKTACEHCLTNDAKWDLRLAQEISSWCALCIVYKTQWGIGIQDQILALIQQVEMQINTTIRDPEGVLTQDGADRILMSIVLTSAYYHGRIYAGSRGSGS